LENLTLTIKASTTVALVGSTGAGKTTAADLLLGLLEPQRGALHIDGQRIAGQNIRAWQRNIGYVPQHIFLSDDTVAANIAFGQPEANVDKTAVERAAKIAELHDFVVNELPDGYQTTVGERGVRLSGGQRQRIGIARALYHDPEVLILDEATSALDNVTEKSVMESVHNIGRRKTILIIAHRLTTVEHCDEIHLMEKGRIRATGSYQELLMNDHSFQEMVRATASSA
jgi:ABC-type multidrug transport system fused ATPase/permease subunit